jgi:predicted ATPase with chaperone activity
MNTHQTNYPEIEASDDRLNGLLARLQNLGVPVATNALSGLTANDEATSEPLTTAETDFTPIAPKKLEEGGLSEALVEELVLKFILATGEASIRQISDQLKLQFSICEQLIYKLKTDQLIAFVNQAHIGDFFCRLSEAGRDRAHRLSNSCSYFGSAPVSFKDYVRSVKAQTITAQNPSLYDLQLAFADLQISSKLLLRLGPAINSGRGMFLFGNPGNGKTSIAERITAAFGETIWIPRAIFVDSDIIRIFDPMNHHEVPLTKEERSPTKLLNNDTIDKRWVRIKRPTIVVGGELRMEHLEIQYNPSSGTSEAPVQMKSNNGVLLIDDFGRQKISVVDLLNRWIVPLDRHHDYLTTTSGKKIQVPFDQLVIFSTNLEPRDLVDDAFLRRIPYKIEVPDPKHSEFLCLFEIMCGRMQCPWNRELVDYLIEKHYMPAQRPFRNCHPRDILLQVKNYCSFMGEPYRMTHENLDWAVESYFSVM